MTKNVMDTTTLSTAGMTVAESVKLNAGHDGKGGAADLAGAKDGAMLTDILGPPFDRQYWESLEVIPSPDVIDTVQQSGLSAEQQAAWAHRLQLTEHMIDLFVSGSEQAVAVNSAASITSVPHISSRDQKLHARLISDLASVRAPDGTALTHKQIAEMYKQAAGNGDPIALFNLGRMYFHGVGVEHSGSEAEEYFCSRALHGYLGPVIYIRALCGN